MLHTFPDMKQYWQFQRLLAINITHFCRAFIKKYWHFRELLAKNTTHFPKVYIKQYWHFQRVPSELSYSKNFFHSSYHTTLMLSESYYQTTTYLELISNSIHTFKELLPNSSKDSFESFNWHFSRKKIFKEKIPSYKSVKS